MSMADAIFKDNLREILDEDWEADNRAVWEDGSPIETKRILQVTNKYDLSHEFPALTLRPLALKACVDEILWIYQKQSNKIIDLNSKIWNSWVKPDGTIGKAYGYQIAKPMLGYDNQIDYVLGTIDENHTSRRIMMNMFNVEDMPEKALIECAYGMNFSVKHGYLHATVNQRSQDFITANNWNVCQYAILTHMIARHCGLKVGILAHNIQDMHVYNKHLEDALIMLDRESYEAPTLKINPDKTDFYSFTVDDFELVNYKKHEQLKIDVAI